MLFEVGEVGAGEDCGVEEGGEADGIKEGDDVGVGGDEGARWHVGAEDGGVVLLDAGFEEVVASLVVEVVLAVFVGPYDGDAVVAGDFPEGQLGCGG